MPTRYNQYRAINSTNVLRRCKEFEQLNSLTAALDTINDFLNARRIAYTKYEDGFDALILKYIELSILLRESPKSGLKRYKMVCLQSSTPHVYLKRIYEFFLQKLTEYGKKEISILRNNYEQDFMRVQYFSKNLNFLWNCYCEILENIKFIPSLLELYAATCDVAISFCGELRRVKELHYLYDLVTFHQISFTKYQGRKDSIDLRDSSVVQSFINIRVEFLKAFVQEESYKDVLRIIKDIDVLTKYPKSGIISIKPEFFMEYLHVLLNLFLSSESYLLYANILYRLFKNSVILLSSDRDSDLKQRLYLSVLAIPTDPYFYASNADQEVKLAEKISMMLNYYDSPENSFFTREELFSFISEEFPHDPTDTEFPNFPFLFKALDLNNKTSDSNPLDFAEKITFELEKLKSMGSHAKKFLPTLQKYFQAKTLKSCSEFYSSLSFAVVEETTKTPVGQMETLIFDFFKFEIDYSKKSVILCKAESLSEKLNRIQANIKNIPSYLPADQKKSLLDTEFELNTNIKKLVALTKDKNKEKLAEKITNEPEKSAPESELLEDSTRHPQSADLKTTNEDQKPQKDKNPKKLKKAKKAKKAQKQDDSKETTKPKKPRAKKLTLEKIKETEQKLLRVNKIEEVVKQSYSSFAECEECNSVKVLRKLLQRLNDRKAKKQWEWVKEVDKLIEVQKRAKEERDLVVQKHFESKRENEDYLQRVMYIQKIDYLNEMSEQIKAKSTERIEEYKKSLAEKKRAIECYSDVVSRVIARLRKTQKEKHQAQLERRKLHKKIIENNNRVIYNCEKSKNPNKEETKGQKASQALERLQTKGKTNPAEPRKSAPKFSLDALNETLIESNKEYERSSLARNLKKSENHTVPETSKADVPNDKWANITLNKFSFSSDKNETKEMENSKNPDGNRDDIRSSEIKQSSKVNQSSDLKQSSLVAKESGDVKNPTDETTEPKLRKEKTKFGEMYVSELDFE